MSLSTLLLPSLAKARSISDEEAATAASNWLRRDPSPLEAAMPSATVRDVRTATDEAGRPLFHIVRMEGGGVVVTSAESGLGPVIAFTEAEDIEETPENPLWDILTQDMAKRDEWIQSVRMPAGRGRLGATAKPESVEEAEEAWDSLLDDAPSGGMSALGLSSISDVRVGKLVQSKWDQDYVGNLPTYNYYTPNNYYCGCIATACAQVMRYHRFPTDSLPVTPITTVCQYGPTPYNLTYIYSTMKGGTYAWDSMPLIPTSSITATQRQAIGKLCYDIGVAVEMMWTGEGSFASLGKVPSALEDVFNYASAQYFMTSGGASISQSTIKAALLTNFDAGYPVLLGIRDSNGDNGHCVVGDGYGYSSGNLYVHINVGYSGSADAWYNLPDLSPNWTVVAGVVYNIFPNRISTSGLLTGRVLNSSGSPVSGATVAAYNSSGRISDTVDTNSKGIYALHVTASQYYRVVATSGSTSAELSSVYVPSSDSTSSAGNSWGNDLVLRSSSYTTPPSTPTSVSATDGTSTSGTTVSWSNVSTATSYTIYRGTTSTPTSVLKSDYTSTSYNDTSATPGTLYYYRVKAVNNVGSSGYSSSDSGYRKLAAPTISSATGSSSGVTLSWGSVTGASHYHVYRATSSSGSKISLGVWQTGTIYIDTTGSAGTTYYYFVRAAVDSSGNRPSDYSASRSASKSQTSGRRYPILDFNGDGESDFMLMDQNDRMWFDFNKGWQDAVLNSSSTVPAPADFDGDGIADRAIYYRPSGSWYIVQSTTGSTVTKQYGWSETCPLPADYDGDGKADLCVYDKPHGDWYFTYSSTNRRIIKNFGWNGCIPVQGDFDGDGKADLAVYCSAKGSNEGDWFIAESSHGGRVTTKNWGWSGTVPAPADYDGDGKTDIAVFYRPTGSWYILYSGGGSRTIQYGWRTVTPVPADYDGDGKDDICLFDEASHIWYTNPSSGGNWQLGTSSYPTVPVLPQTTVYRWFGM